MSVKDRDSELHAGLLTSHGAHTSGPDCEGQRGQRELRAGCSAIGCRATRTGRGDEYQPEQALWQTATSKSVGQERFHVSVHRPTLTQICVSVQKKPSGHTCKELFYHNKGRVYF